MRTDIWYFEGALCGFVNIVIYFYPVWFVRKKYKVNYGQRTIFDAVKAYGCKGLLLGGFSQRTFVKRVLSCLLFIN